jgi:hypothetical protein
MDEEPKSHIPMAIADGFSAIRWKQMALLFVLFILFSSTTFINNALGAIPGAKNGNCPTNKGVLLQATFLVFSMIVVDSLVATHII